MGLDDSIGYLIAKTHKRLKKKFMEILNQYHLTTQQYGVLRRLFENDGLCINEIVNRLPSDNSTVVSIIDKLEKKGLVNRVADPNDRRVNCIYLTDKAKSILPELIVKADMHNKAVVSMLSDKEILMFKKILYKFNSFSSGDGK